MEVKNGIDILEIARIEKSMKSEHFLERVFSQKELMLLKEKNFSAQTAAANFCAKEAFAKAIGTGIRGFSLTEVSILRDSQGEPYIELSGKALELSKDFSFSVSLSHNDTMAIAVVTAYK